MNRDAISPICNNHKSNRSNYVSTLALDLVKIEPNPSKLRPPLAEEFTSFSQSALKITHIKPNEDGLLG